MRVEWACLGELDEEGVVQRVVDFSVRCEELPEQRRDVREMLALERPSRQIPGLQHIGSECTVGTRVGATVGRGGGEGLQHDRGAVALLCVRDAACPISTG